MAQAKTVLLIDEAMKISARERVADRNAMLRLLEQEIHELNQIIRVLMMRVETLEAGVAPDINACTKKEKAN